MLGSEAVAEVKAYMGFRTDGDADILNWMRLGQAQLEKNWPTRPLPWFLISERESTSTETDEERIPFPPGFIEEYEQDALWYVDENGGEHHLNKFDADDLRKFEQRRTGFNTIVTSEIRSPVSYALTGKYFRLFPKPDAAYTIKMMCYSQDEAPTLVGENLWLANAPYVLIGWAGERFAMAARDADALTMFAQMKQSSMAALDIQSVEREMANRRMAMGETK
jgi:hypothetical protein